MASSKTIYGLFVGINTYEFSETGSRSIDLFGCVNDAQLISSLIKERYDLTEQNCLVLTNDQATKLNIVSGFRDHLANAKKNDTAIFYFSGHGSTERADRRMWVDGQRTDRNETLVCHDSRASEPYDLSDKELRILIHELSEKGVNVVTILDSCNSGDATRYLDIDDSEAEEAVARQAPGSHEIRPLDSYLFYDDAKARGWLDDFTQMPEGNHIALSACRNDQLAKEDYYGVDKYGVFTRSLCQAIKQQHFAPSYRNLVDLASQKVNVKVENQTPQVEAIGDKHDLDLEFLLQDIKPVAYSVQYHDGFWWLNAAAAQGININARFALMDGDKKILEATVAKVALADAANSQSQLVLIGSVSMLDQKQQYMAQMIDPAIPKLPVRFVGSDADIAELADALKTSDIRYFVEQAERADYELIADEQKMQLKRCVGLPVYEGAFIKKSQDRNRDAIKALKLAAHMAKWEHTKNLAYNVEKRTIPDDLVSLVIEQQNPMDGTLATLPVKNDAFDVCYQQVAGQESLLKPRVKFTVKLNSGTNWLESQDVFFSLLFIDPVKGSVSVFANNEILRLKKRKEKDGSSTTTKPLQPTWTYVRTPKGVIKTEHSLSVPDTLITTDEYSTSATHDYLKLVVSNFEIDVSTLEQRSLESLLRPRRGANKSIEDDEDWEDYTTQFIPKAITKTYTLNIIKPPTSVLIDDSDTIILSEHVSILPNDITALASLEYSKDNPKAASALRLEPLGAANYSLDSPLQLEFQSSSGSSTSESYMVFSEQDSGYEDAPFQIPLGFSESAQNGKTQVAIQQLPDSVNSGDRSLSGSFLLLFKKIAHEKFKLDYDTARLAIPKFQSHTSLEASDYLEDIKTIKARVADAQKILLFVHGITGDTERMAGVVNREINGQRLGDGYLVLTFDYENLSTPLQETADVLRKKLEAVGLAGDHGKELVIIAHSMGGLVSRWLIEKDPARPAVSKLIMLGTPNGGSPLRNVKKWLMVMLTLAANGISGGIAGASMASLMFLLNRADDTLDEMADDSQTLKYLYEAPDPKIPYYMIAGNTAELQAEIDADGSRINRLLSALKSHAWLGVTDLFSSGLFREKNDVAVSFSSMKHIPIGRTDEMEFLEVDSDHLSYFDSQACIEHIYDIVRGDISF